LAIALACPIIPPVNANRRTSQGTKMAPISEGHVRTPQTTNGLYRPSVFNTRNRSATNLVKLRRVVMLLLLLQRRCVTPRSRPCEAVRKSSDSLNMCVRVGRQCFPTLQESLCTLCPCPPRRLTWQRTIKSVMACADQNCPPGNMEWKKFAIALACRNYSPCQCQTDAQMAPGREGLVRTPQSTDELNRK
jgi:hypothetical protein